MIEPENATDKTIEWTSSDEKIAVVDSKGIVTAGKKATGTAIITAKAKDGSEKFAKCEVTVYSSVEEKINLLIATNNTKAITIDLLQAISKEATAENLASYQATLARRQKVSESVITDVNGVISEIKYENIHDGNHKTLKEYIKNETGCAISNKEGKVVFQLAPINSSNYYVNETNNRIYIGPHNRDQNAGNDSFTYNYSSNVTDTSLGEEVYIPQYGEGTKRVNIAFIYVQMQSYGDDITNGPFVRMIPVLYSLALEKNGTSQGANWANNSANHTSETLLKEWHPVKENQITVNNTNTNEPIVIAYCVEESESLNKK